MIDPWPFLIISAIIDIDFSHEKFSNKRCQSLSTPLERKILLRNTPALCGRFERRFASHRFEVGYEHPTRFQGDVSPRSTVFRSDDQNFQRRGTHPRRSAERERSRWNEIILYGRYSRPCTIEAWWVKIKFFPPYLFRSMPVIVPKIMTKLCFGKNKIWNQFRNRLFMLLLK